MTDFEAIQDPIQRFLEQQKTEACAHKDKHYKLPLSDAFFCAEDSRRNRAFFKAIQKAILSLKKQGNAVRVIDAGAGTGILGCFALSLGADHCIFLEDNPYSLQLNRTLLAHLGLAERSELIQGDATCYQPSQAYDLLISETLTSGFVREDFIAIINHLKPFGSPASMIIPSAFTVTMIEKDKNCHPLAQQVFSFESSQGFKPQTILLQNPSTQKFTWHTQACLYDDVYLESGDCISFLNEQSTGLEKEAHPLFTIA